VRETIQKNSLTGGTTYSGTDSKGNYYNKTCNQFGCNWFTAILFL